MRAWILVAAACCACLALAPPAAAAGTSTGATLTIAPTTQGSARLALAAEPARPVVGQSVRLSVAAPPPGASRFAWDLVGRGSYGRDTGTTPHVEARFASPGVHRVAVRFTVPAGSRVAVLAIDVGARPVAARRPRGSRPAAAERTQAITAHAAGDPGVTVADFHFTPSSTTIHVGDTITWTNDGPSSHTATAHNGAFDTGVLKKGQSASHTFAQAGTFTYFCQIHPFMHGTIVVLAAGTTTSAATTKTPSAATPTATTAVTATTAAATTPAPSGPTLPNTGFDVAAALAAGLLLLGAGVALRRVRPR
jgi:LPXTG-motif cell wall-anchored protein